MYNHDKDCHKELELADAYIEELEAKLELAELSNKSLWEALEESEADLAEVQTLLDLKREVADRLTSSLNRAAKLFFGASATS